MFKKVHNINNLRKLIHAKKSLNGQTAKINTREMQFSSKKKTPRKLVPLSYLRYNFPWERLISHQTNNPWPSQTPDNFLRGYLKDRVCENNPQTREDIIRKEMRQIAQEMLNRVKVIAKRKIGTFLWATLYMANFYYVWFYFH